MRKNIKYSVSSIIIILSLMLGYVVYAEEVETESKDQPVACTMEAKACPDGTFVGRVSPNCEFAKCPSVNKEDQIQREENRNEFKNKREEIKNRFETVIQSIKEKREQFKKEFDANKEEVKSKISEMRTNFKENIKNIKNEAKKLSAEKILEIIQAVNTKITDDLSNKVNQIENVLVSIESRISKAETKGLDISSVKVEVEKAKQAIADAREAISVQSKKVYDTSVISEVTLKSDMKTLRDTFSKDIKALRETIKLAHIAVRDTATTLAKIPKINEGDSTEVEDNNINN